MKAAAPQFAPVVARTIKPVVAPLLSPVLLRKKCSCGGEAGPGGECAACRKKRETSLQRRAIGGAPEIAPPIVHDVLRSPGQPLDAASRALFESRLGHDFSRVRIHADHRAADSARSVNAMAYTVGSNVVFGADRFSPHTETGRGLLAHELAHVVQQRDVASSIPSSLPIGAESSAWEQQADSAAKAAATTPSSPPMATPSPAKHATLSRVVDATATHCVAGRRGAPNSFLADVTAADTHAGALAQASAILAAAGSATATMGIDVTTSGVGQAYLGRFGRPPAVRGGFRNRVSGRVFAQRNDAISSELESLSDRLQSISDSFSRTIHYGCINGRMTFHGCEGHCSGRSASTCGGNRAILVCPSFWAMTDAQKSTLLIHEMSHMLWGSEFHFANFRHASCYANFVADLFNLPATTPACPTPRP